MKPRRGEMIIANEDQFKETPKGWNDSAFNPSDLNTMIFICKYQIAACHPFRVSVLISVKSIIMSALRAFGADKGEGDLIGQSCPKDNPEITINICWKEI